MPDTMIICHLNKRGWCFLGVFGALILMYLLSSKKYISSLRGDVVSVGQLLKQCIFLAEEAGGIIKLAYNPRKLNTRLKSGAGGPQKEPVTDVDIMSHRIIASILSKSFSGVQVISEEHPAIIPSDQIVFPPPETFHTDYSRVPNDDLYLPASDLSVWVDPLDATQEFTDWSWAMYAMSSDLVNLVANRRKSVSSPSVNTPINITVSRSHLNASTLEYRVNQLLAPQRAKLMPAGGSGFKVLSLIDGSAQAYLHPTKIRRWDICAAQAVLESTGGRMLGLDGSRLSYSPVGDFLVPASVGVFATAEAAQNEVWRPKLEALLQKP